MIPSILSRLVILLFGTLYPAYASYKAVRTKNVKEYVKWMMYWIVFALFTCAETITDIFLSWFPLYYEFKIILVVWLLSPATKGSSILYRKFVHPALSRREQEIDEYISKAKEQSYKQVLDLGSKGMNVLMQTALKSGGGLVNQLKKSYSLSDLTDKHERDVVDSDEGDVLITDPRLKRRKHSPRRQATSAIYFSEIDVRHDAVVSLQADEVSSGYSSGEVLHSAAIPKLQAREGLVRTGSIGSSTRARPTRVTRSTIIHKTADEIAVIDNDKNIILINDQAVDIETMCQKSDSSSEGEFYDADVPQQVSNQQISPLSTQHIQPKLHVDEKEEQILKADDNKKALDNDEKGDKISIKSDELERKGRYRKKHAPPPPQSSSSTRDEKCKEIPTIKATLVLKPGLVRSFENLSSSSKSEIFLAPSPKAKRRSKKLPSPVNKLLQIPKKIGLWPKDDSSLKRNSWHDMTASSSSSHGKLSKELSKSDDFSRWHKAFLSMQEGES